MEITKKMELKVNESTGKIYIHNKTSNKNGNHIDSIQQTTGIREPNSLVGSIKSFVSNIFIKPIIDMTSMLVGTDTNHHETSSPPISLKSMLWNETTMNNCGGGGSVVVGNSSTNGSLPTNKNPKSPPTIYLDNHSSDRFFITSCEKSVLLSMNFYQQDTFFDCDDYIDGGEDTIDFVADSTKIQFNSFDNKLLPTKHLNNSPKNSSALSIFEISSEKSINDVNIKPDQPIPSPEEIACAHLFTKFFRLDNCKQKSSLAQCYKQHKARQLQRKKAPPSKERTSMSSSSSLLSLSPCRRTSEIESDDSFIVFEDSSPKFTTSVDENIITKPTTTSLKNICNRQRQLSECSDDFIIQFESDAEDDTTDEDFTDSTDDSDGEDESDIVSDCSDYPAISKQKHDVENKEPDSGFEEKKCFKVRFNPRPIVHEIRAWNFAYKEARKGKWEQMGRDRERFEKRINELSHILSPILEADHRQKIYEQRFHDEHVNHNKQHTTKHISNKQKFFNCK